MSKNKNKITIKEVNEDNNINIDELRDKELKNTVNSNDNIESKDTIDNNDPKPNKNEPIINNNPKDSATNNNNNKPSIDKQPKKTIKRIDPRKILEYYDNKNRTIASYNSVLEIAKEIVFKNHYIYVSSKDDKNTIIEFIKNNKILDGRLTHSDKRNAALDQFEFINSNV